MYIYICVYIHIYIIDIFISIFILALIFVDLSTVFLESKFFFHKNTLRGQVKSEFFKMV